MNALSQWLEQYADKDVSRMHMPGHKGNCPFLEPLGAKWDVTEVKGADCLYHSDGVIASLERQLSEAYRAQTAISAGGSTLCIQAMVKLFAGRRWIAMRNSHAAFFHACALLGVEPEWITCQTEEATGLMRIPQPQEIERILSQSSRLTAVYLTSPDYFGRRADVAGIAKVCRRYNALLVVDNAHGAHLRWLPKNLHPIWLGADVCCDSLHKTMPALTGAAVLHVRPGLIGREEVKTAMALFGSTSPSYLIMHSIGLCADWMQREAVDAFARLEQKRKKLPFIGSKAVLPSDCSKISIDAYSLGLTGTALAEHFRKLGVEPEYADERYVVMMPSCFTSEEDWNRLAFAFLRIPRKAPLPFEVKRECEPKRVTSMREAMLSLSERIPTERAQGRICAQTVFVCPPGAPMVAAGERIEENVVCALKKSGILFVDVLK